MKWTIKSRFSINPAIQCKEKATFKQHSWRVKWTKNHVLALNEWENARKEKKKWKEYSDGIGFYECAVVDHKAYNLNELHRIDSWARILSFCHEHTTHTHIHIISKNNKLNIYFSCSRFSYGFSLANEKILFICLVRSILFCIFLSACFCSFFHITIVSEAIFHKNNKKI